MANEPAEDGGIRRFLSGALENPLIGIGLGMLGAPRGATFGQRLGQGVGTATDLRSTALRNQAVREELVARKAAREQEAARRAAWDELLGVLGGGGSAAGTVAGGDAAATVAGGPVDLLENFPGIGPRGRPAVAIDESGAVPGVSGPAGMDRAGILALLAKAQPDAFAQGLLGQLFREPAGPTSFQRDYAFLLRQGLTPEAALDRLRRGTVVHVGEGEKPLSPSDLLRFRLPDGSVPPAGATTAEVTAMGGVLMTDAQQKGLDAAQKYGPVMDRIEELALGEGGIFTDIEPGLGNRVQAGFDLFIGSLTGDRPNVALYDDLVGSTLAPLIKQFGESGALAEGDVARAEGLLPRIRDEFLLPNTRAQAIEKLNTLREMLDRGARNIERGVFPGRQPAPKPEAGAGGAKEGAAPDFAALPPAELLGVDVTTLKGEALKAYQAAMDAAGF